jgi:hypothetical protein
LLSRGLIGKTHCLSLVGASPDVKNASTTSRISSPTG